MRKTFVLWLSLALMAISCDRYCETTDVICKQTPPNDELCLAYFERWFFDKKSNACKQISYSGCSSYGFATMQECEGCKCN